MGGEGADEEDGMHGDDREKQKHNGKEGRGPQFPSLNSSSVLTVCEERGANVTFRLCANCHRGVALSHKT